MIHLDLDIADTKMLSEILACDLSELGSEISHTDAKDYRDRLKVQRAFLRRLVAQLEASTESEEGVLAR
jgi:hypothetical protein